MADPVYRGRRWRDLTAAILERDRWTCQLCGRPIDRHARPRSGGAGVADHIVPVLQGGAWHDPANLRAVHAACNTARAARRTRNARAAPYPLPREW